MWCELMLMLIEALFYPLNNIPDVMYTLFLERSRKLYWFRDMFIGTIVGLWGLSNHTSLPMPRLYAYFARLWASKLKFLRSKINLQEEKPELRAIISCVIAAFGPLVPQLMSLTTPLQSEARTTSWTSRSSAKASPSQQEKVSKTVGSMTPS